MRYAHNVLITSDITTLVIFSSHHSIEPQKLKELQIQWKNMIIGYKIKGPIINQRFMLMMSKAYKAQVNLALESKNHSRIVIANL